MPTTTEKLPQNTININGTEFDVNLLSAEVQSLVEIYKRWSAKEDEARGEVAIMSAAKQTLSTQIIATVQAETAEVEEAVAEVAPEAVAVEGELVE